ncbi:DNA-3-methyladenine glycosylase family protein [Frondihabitans cladoniiphilus]|uniref:DNA-3-methyladenine glycosylase II n=1 Tax=Frondihabitans cladoniiphilus TaxID=715785 RepID=A0ABP8W9F5_9MICO
MHHVSLRLPFTQPLDPSNLLGHLVATAVPGVEEYRDGAYRSTVRLPHGPGIVAVRPPTEGTFPVTLQLADERDLAEATRRVRFLLDLDSDPVATGEGLGRDARLRPLVAAAPGRRVPRILDPASMALRAVLGQQVSTAAARTHAGRLVAALGEPVVDDAGGLTHLFPRPAEIVAATADLDDILRMPASRRRTVLTMASALADGLVDLGPNGDWRVTRAALLALPGIGPWTVETIAMRALGDPDAFLESDLGILKAATPLGLPAAPRPLLAASRAWSPWRAYAVQYLWATMPHAVNSLPDAVPTAVASPVTDLPEVVA